MFFAVVLIFRGIAVLVKGGAKWTTKLRAKALTTSNPRAYFWTRFGPVLAALVVVLSLPAVVVAATAHPVGNDTAIIRAGEPSSAAIASASGRSATVSDSSGPIVPSDSAAGQTAESPPAAGGVSVLGAGIILPNRSRTPGATNPVVTQASIGQTICVVGWTSTIRPSSSVTTAIKVKQLASGYAYNGDTARGDYEEDHLISLELGGSPSAEANLWPEPYNVAEGARVKDRIENKLHDLVCQGQLTLRAAQTAIASDWWHAYETYVAASTTPAAPAASAPPAPAPVAPAPAGPAAPAPQASNIVHAGSFCSTGGATGVTSTGRAMVCKTTSTDSRLRWRSP